MGRNSAPELTDQYLAELEELCGKTPLDYFCGAACNMLPALPALIAEVRRLRSSQCWWAAPERQCCGLYRRDGPSETEYEQAAIIAEIDGVE